MDMWQCGQMRVRASTAQLQLGQDVSQVERAASRDVMSLIGRCIESIQH
jgi:hypothetical protein